MNSEQVKALILEKYGNRVSDKETISSTAGRIFDFRLKDANLNNLPVIARMIDCKDPLSREFQNAKSDFKSIMSDIVRCTEGVTHNSETDYHLIATTKLLAFSFYHNENFCDPDEMVKFIETVAARDMIWG